MTPRARRCRARGRRARAARCAARRGGRARTSGGRRAWPASRIARTTSGCSSALRADDEERRAYAACFASASRTRGVQPGAGPSSNVSATPRAPRGPRTTRVDEHAPGEGPNTPPRSSPAYAASASARPPERRRAPRRRAARRREDSRASRHRGRPRAGGMSALARAWARLGAVVLLLVRRPFAAGAGDALVGRRHALAARRRPSRFGAAVVVRRRVLSSSKKPPSTAAIEGKRRAPGSSPTGRRTPPDAEALRIARRAPVDPLPQREHERPPRGAPRRRPSAPPRSWRPTPRWACRRRGPVSTPVTAAAT